MKSADIKGYRELSENDVAIINHIKELEITVGGFWRDIVDNHPTDMRWAWIAKTHFQEGFTALVRSIAQPKDVFDKGA